jgi:hypothetical protein
MTKAATQIPVVWRTDDTVAERLLGDAGRPLLDRILDLTRQVAAKRGWPLKEIKVESYQDPEADWEYMLLTLDFDCGRPKAKRLWLNYLKVVWDMRQEMDGPAKSILASKFYYDFESDP